MAQLIKLNLIGRTCKNHSTEEMMKLTSRFILFICLLAVLLVGGCAIGPPYQEPPDLTIPGPGGTNDHGDSKVVLKTP